VVNTNPECVVLYQRADNNVICSPFDRNLKQVDRVYRLINLSTSDYQLKYEKLGQLKLKPLSTPTPIPTNTPTITITPTQTVTVTPTP
jgi:hypothetical protein